MTQTTRDWAETVARATAHDEGPLRLWTRSE